ncbi:MAG TPA: tetratricopeptide repeat protein, partial [Candidatus Binatia bacterium]|nr:tetratricopeptide repeat protein [Candidatus Binatia bacterium]
MAVLLAALLAVGSLGSARADYNAGLQAFNAGDYKRALKEWQAPAEEGDAQAQHGLGLIYETGRGLDKPDLTQAIHWYQASADQDYPPALNNLAMLYSSGRGVAKDQPKAIQLWKQAAEAGNTTAEFNLGIQYMLG